MFRIDPPGHSGDSAVGICSVCCIFCCTGHGKRDHDTPEFICLLCMPPKLIASALITSRLANPYLLEGHRDLMELAERFNRTYYLSLKEFRERMPDLYFLTEQIGKTVIRYEKNTGAEAGNSYAAVFRDLDDESWLLVRAAAVLLKQTANRLYLNRLPGYLQYLYEMTG
ncbi:hypothetical protein FPZ43_18245 [Mucilaginibacter pallidiroseus]|uniref:Uncharacterized protein n=1 Tax=Mucilaginibacter pallidiroseus TaxID=2599295 RepID=A0A563U041_9SPHI|nr:hypothetical protein [Mucilaginibacter pallidiroseus]TWR24372.1 hypothetical protein FPZ43_18245 [Mucilaginibacter pallidiroseus]